MSSEISMKEAEHIILTNFRQKTDKKAINASVRLTKKEYAECIRQANTFNMTISSYIRRCIKNDFKRS